MLAEGGGAVRRPLGEHRDGREHIVPLDEPERASALHGLTRGRGRTPTDPVTVSGRTWARHRERRVVLLLGEAFRYVTAFIGDTLPEAGPRRMPLGPEPITCPPDDVRTGQCPVHQRPGETFSASWGVAGEGRAGRSKHMEVLTTFASCWRSPPC